MEIKLSYRIKSKHNEFRPIFCELQTIVKV